MKKTLLLVTFPVDFGSKTFEQRYIKLFENYLALRVYRFVPDQFAPHQKYSNPLLRFSATIGRKLLGSIELQRQVRKATRESRNIVFQGVSPALFAYSAIAPKSSFIVIDLWHDDVSAMANLYS